MAAARAIEASSSVTPLSVRLESSSPLATLLGVPCCPSAVEAGALSGQRPMDTSGSLIPWAGAGSELSGMFVLGLLP